MILVGCCIEVVQAIVTCFVGVTSLAIAVEGCLFQEAGIFKRVLTGIAAPLLFHGGTETDIIAAILLGIVIAIQWVKNRSLISKRMGEIHGSSYRRPTF